MGKREAVTELLGVTRAPKERVFLGFSGSRSLAVGVSKWGHLRKALSDLSPGYGTTQGEPRVTPPIPPILAHIPRPSLSYPLQ